MNFDQSGHARIVGERPPFAYPENGAIAIARMAVFYPFGLSCRCFFAGARAAMQLFADYLPVLVFFAAYVVTKDIYFAIVVLMVVAPVVFASQWLLTKKINKISAVSTGLVIAMGGITLALDNPWFFYWKPTVLNWAIALFFLGSHFFGEKTPIQKLLDLTTKDSGERIELDRSKWRQLNLMWVGFFLISGTANIYVAYNFSEPTWVNFKLFGLIGLTFVFAIFQSVWIARNIEEHAVSSNDPES